MRTRQSPDGYQLMCHSLLTCPPHRLGRKEDLLDSDYDHLHLFCLHCSPNSHELQRQVSKSNTPKCCLVRLGIGPQKGKRL